MVVKNSQKPEANLFNNTDYDEGWWSSVLQDYEAAEPPSQQVEISSGKKDLNNAADWGRIMEIYHQDEIITLRVHGYNRGGLLVQGNEAHGFVPVSHLIGVPGNLENEEKRRQFLSRYIGKSLKLKVIECEPKEERIVFSERAAIAGEGTRRHLLLSMKPGDEVAGVVTNVTDFGVFIDLGGIEGLIHVSEISWGRVQHPAEMLNIGQKVRALVLSVSEENSRVALSLKRLDENPWDILDDSLRTGDVISVKISAIMRYGVFVRLAEGVEGLIHISSIRMPPGIRDIKRFLHIGQLVQARVLHIDAERRRLGLALDSVE